MWVIVEGLLAIFGVLFVFTQMILPCFMNLPFFWYFRKPNKIENKKCQIHEIEEDLQVEDLESELLKKKKILDKSKKTNSRQK